MVSIKIQKMQNYFNKERELNEVKEKNEITEKKLVECIESERYL